MRIIARSNLKEFWNIYKDAEQPLKTWFDLVKKADWDKPNDVKQTFNSADIIPNNRIVFNIKGNNYRLIVQINYRFKIVYIRFIGTHTEYNKIDVAIV
ncbi:Uncharacterized protein NF27_AZ00020 [Candidatus Jidaibacter acanthamoeba]|uniref:Toxin RelE n=1 Tax=Candidatus Jidaibacter acanthamoebae TaxID=86105 RepID=A0A0C1MVI4_9RICK|nr:type II toxin-antitoxin system HigB family toxin [Candidatus Jidaibacter acanthamoeba]KIE06232.1 Uncharacterized protein NF27_AZ00020 [Candidatus Jidaibacter acanthamoeba]